MYCSPDVDEFLSGRGVYLISDHLSPEDLKDKFSFEDVNVLSQALDNGTAAFHPIPNEHLGLAASGTVLDMYLDDLQKRSNVTATQPTQLPFSAPYYFNPHGLPYTVTGSSIPYSSITSSSSLAFALG